ncbi:hypothetical protein TTRE_0000557401 [Trichuris trichiura]|uniref:Uncharacterized protein n=1 Tax=Trichuris trichiura TaxID=36087 RepID=A0A077ZCL5_TRITR|nr:hypothetical protein TTRE_0000557401 [Trichuris trichiura]
MTQCTLYSHAVVPLNTAQAADDGRIPVLVISDLEMRNNISVKKFHCFHARKVNYLDMNEESRKKGNVFSVSPGKDSDESVIQLLALFVGSRSAMAYFCIRQISNTVSFHHRYELGSMLSKSAREECVLLVISVVENGST